MQREILKIYHDNIKKLYGFYYSRTLSKEIAEDLTSEAFTTFAESAAQNWDSIDDPTKYLFGIAKNVFMQHLREKYTHTNTDLENLEHVDFEEFFKKTSDEGPKIYLEDIAEKYIEDLPKAQKRVISMRLLDKMTLKEIAQELGKDMNYVKTTQKRAIKSLKKMVECTPATT